MKFLERIGPMLVLGVFILLLLTIIRTSIFGIVDNDKHIYF